MEHIWSFVSEQGQLLTQAQVKLGDFATRLGDTRDWVEKHEANTDMHIEQYRETALGRDFAGMDIEQLLHCLRKSVDRLDEFATEKSVRQLMAVLAAHEDCASQCSFSLYRRLR